MHELHLEPDHPVLHLSAIVDTEIEASGFGPRSLYVEACWLGVLGPTATWLFRYLAPMVIEAGDAGVDIDALDLARTLGLGGGLKKQSMLTRGLCRMVLFHVAVPEPGGLRIRRALPLVPGGLVSRMSPHARHIHDLGRRQHPSVM